MSLNQNRNLLLLLLLPIITGILFFASCKTAEDKAVKVAKKPNIIYILADDLGYAELGSYGQELIETPHLDALAKAGMRFTDHYAGAPVCAPSRCVLLTGKHTGNAYIRGNDEWASRGDVWDYEKAVNDPNLEGQRPLPESEITLGNILQKAGYKTGIVGKWGLGAPLTDGIPTKRGFDFFYGYNCQRQAHNLYPKHLWKNEEKVWLDNELVAPGTKIDKDADPQDLNSYAKFFQKDYAPAMMQKEALSFIENSKDKPFFLYYASPLTHAPLQVPQKYIDKYVEKFGDEDPYLGQRGYFPNRYPKAAYAAMVSYLDDQVGELVAKLKETGQYENTLIIFSSDNGPTYNGGTASPYFDSARPFKSEYGWGKGFVHEGGIRVPMIAVWEGKIKAGTQSDLVSAFWDVLPTLAEVAGTTPPENTDGISFLPELLGQSTQKKHDFLYWEFPAYDGQQAVRMGKWKGIRKDIFKDNMEIELYDLEADPQEQDNVAAAHPEIVDQIQEIMKKEHHSSTSDRFRISQLGDIK
ncbi:arylsulfatase [Echinicola sp. CAU 1574]|uniref:Arylsulfatase n=1 Tax=Echinicola arenosa TaxID=2774144 RepID=A0ABR9AL23_9BACT|nr:arylsulfatase [Echinicola arenosa]MBD8489510.1 arylsulfatase [Echinicola arenosa]